MRAIYIVLGGVLIIAILRWSPMDYVFEAGGPAYYQAGIAYQRGDAAARDRIAAAFQDQKISMHDYSAVVFPAFLKVARDREELFPTEESNRTQDELRDRLASEISRPRN